jgi:SAM-dependent methyltransferase
MDRLVVPDDLCRNATKDPRAASRLIAHLCEHLGVRDLGDTEVLDFGCGVRFTQAFLNEGIPIKRYVGVDVSLPVIEYLRANVADPRFEFCRLDAQNDLYNPTGQPLETLTVPEIEGRRFDVACLFSVFTHLAPHDYVAMLRLVRRFVRDDGRLFYTVFINERTDGGHGYVDRLANVIQTSTDSRVQKVVGERLQNAAPPDFRDADPNRPLLVALYSRRHALELIEGTGWEVVSVSPPGEYLQHHILCRPT